MFCNISYTKNRFDPISKHREESRKYDVKWKLDLVIITLTATPKKNVIYMIQCNHCHKQFIGETKRRLEDRFNKHRRPVDKQII